jgi:hypothetical protein
VIDAAVGSRQQRVWMPQTDAAAVHLEKPA